MLSTSTIRLLTLLLVVVIVSSLYNINNINKSYRYVSSKSSSLILRSVPGALGSDVLQRPEDEDSPEFAEYLKQLMALQVNRAKAGFASPSSASADAYIAKLNRIKVEKLALRRAGLPDDIVDTSYKKEDYVAATLEAQEPLVSNSVLTGEAAIAKQGRTKSGSKTRDLTEEEVAASKAAEAAVAAAIVRQNALPEDQRAAIINKAEASNSKPVIRVTAEDEALINSVLGKAASSGNKIAAKAIGVSLSESKTSQQNNLSQTSYAESLKKAQQLKNQQSQPPQKNEKVNLLLQQAKDQLIQQKKQQPQQPQQPQQQQQQQKQPQSQPQSQSQPQQKQPQQNKNNYMEAAQVMQKPPTSQSNVGLENKTPIEYGRKLSVEELEVSAKALQLLVKHRGGGPFGIGRLVGSEVNALENNLRAAYSMLENDMKKTKTEGKPIVKEVKASNAKDDSEPLPDLKKVVSSVSQSRQEPETVAPKQIQQASTTASIKAPPAPIKAPPAPVKVPVQSQAVSKPPPTPVQSIPTESLVEVPISQGLQDFLTSPQSLSVIELNGLRDGLIQCLSMIQMEIMKRPADLPTNMPLVPIAQPPQADPMEVVERAIMMNEKLSSDEVEKDIKVALGLLLKHRGGPGFGHGRLQGKELSLLEDKLRTAANLLSQEAV